MTHTEWKALAEANLAHDRPTQQRARTRSAEPNRQTVYATMPATPRGIARVRVTL